MASPATPSATDAVTQSVSVAARDERTSGPIFPAWPIVMLGVPIVLRAAIYASALTIEPWTSNPSRIVPAWAQIGQASLYFLIASLLIASGRRDRRAWSLGLFILDAGSTLLEPFVRGIHAPPDVIAVGLNLRTDAFQAALLWFFAGVFPKRATGSALPRTFFFGTAAAFALGLGLFALDGYANWQDGVSPIGLLATLASVVRRHGSSPGDWFFTLQFLALAPLLVAQPIKLRQSGREDRKRFAWLVAGLVGGYAPLMIEVFLETFWSGYIEAAAPYLRLRGALLMTGWTLVPIAAAYAALFQRTLDLRLILRAAAQYVLARSVVRILVLLPLVALTAIVIANRDATLSSLVMGADGLALVALTIVAIVAVLARQRLLTLVDRGFSREPLDVRRTLTEVLESVRRANTVEEICQTATKAIARSLHPKFTIISVAANDGDMHAQDADLPPLSRSGALVQIVGDGSRAITVDSRSGSAFDRLPDNERSWIRASHATVLVGLRAANGELHGLIALGEKRSDLDYSDDEKSLLEAVGSAAGLALDRVLAAERSTGTDVEAAAAARECVECGTVVEPKASRCDACGGLLQRAPIPLVFEDRLFLKQRIGAGGMGVVYRAIDARLDQVRAVKTLPRTDVAMVARLRREARAMAAVQHPNLAILHSLEIWKTRPLLVMEFLEGGSLAELIRRGSLPADRIKGIALSIAGALGALHAAGILHRDIKPSNIAFTASGTPKLLDFGLAKFVSSESETMAIAAETATGADSFSTVGHGIRGTPAYMSPEVLMGSTPSPSDDLWSLSVTLLEAYTGKNPFKAATVAESMSRVLTSGQWIEEGSATQPLHLRRLFGQLLGPVHQRPSDVESWTKQARVYQE